MSRLLECDFYSAQVGAVVCGCAGWGGNVRSRGTAICHADGIGRVGRHQIICVTMTEFGFQTCKDMLFAAVPGNDDFRAGDLSACCIDDDDL